MSFQKGSKGNGPVLNVIEVYDDIHRIAVPPGGIETNTKVRYKRKSLEAKFS